MEVMEFEGTENYVTESEHSEEVTLHHYKFLLDFYFTNYVFFCRSSIMNNLRI